MFTLSQKIPSGMFRILDSKNRDVFAQALLHIYNKINVLPVVKKEDILNDLEYFFGAVNLDEDGELVEEDEGPDDARHRARVILNTLTVRGWITEEVVLSDYSTQLYIPAYAFPFLKALQEILDGKEQEYGSLIFRSYTALYHASHIPEERDTLFDAILSAYDASNELKRNLVQFYNSLHAYRIDVDKTTESQAILNDLLDNFREQAKKEYAPIKTVDSYSRYKSPIIDSTYEILSSDELLNDAASQMVKKGRADNRAHAAEAILEMLRSILSTYEELSGTMSNIENEYRIYVEKVEQKIRAMLTLDRSVSGNLVRILKAAGAVQDKGTSTAVCQVMEQALAAPPVASLSSDILYRKPETRANPKPPNKIRRKTDAASEEQKKRVAARLQQEARRKARIRSLLHTVTDNESSRISTKDLPVINEEDYMNVYAMVKYGADEKETDYRITEVQSGKSLSRGKFRIPDLTIERNRANDSRKIISASDGKGS